MNPRIISGTAKNLKLSVPESGTRPMTDRVKSALFSIINDKIQASNVLDLFAGSGALGIECLSRGATHATFVEINPESALILKENIEKAGFLDKSQVINGDANEVINDFNEKYDIIFVSPPHKDVNNEIINNAGSKLAKEGLLVAEHPSEISLSSKFENLNFIETRTYGITSISFFTSNNNQ